MDTMGASVSLRLLLTLLSVAHALGNSHFSFSPVLQVGCEEVTKNFHEHYGAEPSRAGDENLAVQCTNAKSSCCTGEMLGHYSLTSNRQFYQTLHSTTSILKQSLKNNAQYYRAEVMRLLDGAENNTKGLLTTFYRGIPSTSHHSLVTNFFLELQLYVGQYDVDISASVDRFFNDLFPLVFEHLVLNSSYVQPFGPEYQDCLRHLRSQVYPAPMGDYPTQMQEQISRSLSVARLFLGSLDLMYQALDRADNLTLTPDCENALTRLEYCAHCEGYLSAKPCQDFCLNVMHGCLVGVSDLEPVWKQFLGTLTNFVSTVSAIYNLEQILPKIYEMVSNSIKYAIENAGTFYFQVTDHRMCGAPKTTSSSVSASDIIRIHRPEELAREYIPVSPTNSGSRIISSMETYISNLQTSQSFFKELGKTLCSKHDADPGNLNCWNGQEIGRYEKSVPDPLFYSQIGANPELSIPSKKPPAMQHIADNLKMMEKLLHSKASLLGMAKDDYEPHNVHGSFGGYSDRYNSRFYSDDEDDDDQSGSGSGDDWDVPYPAIWTVTKSPEPLDPGIPYKTDNTDKPTTVPKTVNGPKPGSGATNHYCRLTIMLTLAFSVLFLNR